MSTVILDRYSLLLYRKVDQPAARRKGLAMNRNDQPSFARRLTTALNASDRTQRDIAKELGVREATISAWKHTTEGSLPEGEHMIRLPALLNVSGHWLLTGEGAMRQTTEDSAERLELISALAVGGISVRDMTPELLEQARDAAQKTSAQLANRKPTRRKKKNG